jgi:hypothetical protein
MELTQNKQTDSPLGRHLVLEWAYQSVYGTLWRMNYGAGGRPNLTGLLREQSPPSNDDRWLSHLDPVEQIEKFVPQNLVEEDWLARKRAERDREMASVPEPEIFGQLVNAHSARTLHRLASKSRWLLGSPVLKTFLREVAEDFLSIKANPRFPQSADKQIDFVARGIAAVVAGYKPNTGHKYAMSLIERCEACHDKPAIIQLNRDSGIKPFREKSALAEGDKGHTAEQCRHSTWPCPIHHPFSPSFSVIPWCGTC